MIVFAMTVPGGEVSLWHLFMQASWVVKLVMIGLMLASVWSWAIIIEKFVAVRKDECRQ
jgi:biopolymer transport protein TolQ